MLGQRAPTGTDAFLGGAAAGERLICLEKNRTMRKLRPGVPEKYFHII